MSTDRAPTPGLPASEPTSPLAQQVQRAYATALAQRLAQQPARVQAVLQQRLAQRAAAAGARVSPHTEGHQGGESPSMARQAQAVAALTRHLEQRAQGSRDDVAGITPTRPAELKSARRFGEVWVRMDAQRQVAQAADRAPENAGPLNSHTLMLRTLTLMQTLSPDYLSAFMQRTQALLWLEEVVQQTALKDGRATRKPRAGKAQKG